MVFPPLKISLPPLVFAADKPGYTRKVIVPLGDILGAPPDELFRLLVWRRIMRVIAHDTSPSSAGFSAALSLIA